MNLNNYILYKHTSPSGKCYIGITSQNPEKRWGYNGRNYLLLNLSGTPKHPAFYNAIIKYGWDNIKHEVLYVNLNKEEACKLEQLLISYYKLLGLSYNITDGGEGINGYRFTDEQKLRMSHAHCGMKQSQETIDKRVSKNLGKQRTTLLKMKTSKAVLQFTEEGNFILEYFGVREAGRLAKINSSHIGDCCNYKRKTAGGFVWKWKNNT